MLLELIDKYTWNWYFVTNDFHFSQICLILRMMMTLKIVHT